MPSIFQGKGMSKRLLSIGFGLVFVATILISFDAIYDEIRVFDFTNQEFKNGTLVSSGKEIDDRDRVLIPMPDGAFGPESLAFDGDGGGPYTGISDGRIIRWRANESRWVDFVVTSSKWDGCVGPHDHTYLEHICGRPLGLGFYEKTGELYIADAYLGLLTVGPNGGQASPVATEVDGVAFGFTNALDIDQTSGVVYFTDSSTRFTRRNHVSAIISGDNTGRLMKFEAKTNKTTLLLDGLMFPNGVALSENGDFLLLVETASCKLLKFWLETRRFGQVEVVTQFPGFPDNIKKSKNGEFWVGINSRRGKALEWLIHQSWIGKLVVQVSALEITKLHSYFARFMGCLGMGIRLNREGIVVEVLDSKKWEFVSEVYEQNGDLWVASVTTHFVIKEKIRSFLDG